MFIIYFFVSPSPTQTERQTDRQTDTHTHTDTPFCLKYLECLNLRVYSTATMDSSHTPASQSHSHTPLYPVGETRAWVKEGSSRVSTCAGMLQLDIPSTLRGLHASAGKVVWSATHPSRPRVGKPWPIKLVIPGKRVVSHPF